MDVQRQGQRGMRIAAALAAMVVHLTSGIAMASVAPEDPQAEARPIRPAPDRIKAPSDASPAATAEGLWVWSAGRRAFRLADTIAGGNSPHGSVQAIDLDTGDLAGKAVFPAAQPAWTTHPAVQHWGRGQVQSGAVDQANGRFFVAYQADALLAASTQRAAVDQDCLNLGGGQTGKAVCMAGYHIVDGRTMEVTGQLPLSLRRVDSAGVYVIPRATTYLPGEVTGHGDKLLAIVIEQSIDPAAIPAERQAGRYELERVLLVQWDVADAKQEWALQLTDCRGARESQGVGVAEARRRPNPALIMPAGPQALWVACHGDSSASGTMVHVPLGPDGTPAGVVQLPALEPPSPHAPGEPPSPPEFATQDAEAYRGPEKVVEFWGDPESQRVLMRMVKRNPNGEVWAVFDGKVRQFLGTIGTGNAADKATDTGDVVRAEAFGSVTLDPTSGRFYVLHTNGLYVADVRRTPLAQALFYPSIVSDFSADWVNGGGWPLGLDLASGKAPRRLLYPVDRGTYGVIEDHMPVEEVAPDDQAVRTLDLNEQDGVTSSVLDGAARGYGVRAILIAGVEGMTRYRNANAVGWGRALYEDQYDNRYANAPSLQEFGAPRTERCSDENREIVLGFIGHRGPAVVDAAGSRGGAVPMLLDGTTVADLQTPASRCTRKDWEGVWSTALFGRAPADEPGLSSSLQPVEAECLRGAEAQPQGDGTGQSATSGDPSHPFFARVECDDGQAGGYSYARGGTPGIHVGEAVSSFRIYRDPDRGVVSRVESVARAIRLADAISIDTVRGVAESWANGRRQPIAQADRDPGDSPACDFQRTAGTCYRRHLFGLRTPGYSCGPCGDEAAFVEELNRAFQGDGRAALRQPDPALAAGSEDGAIAAITKSQPDRFADLTLNMDTVQTIVPTLEVVRYATPYRPIPNFEHGPTYGRQIYQFAGVEVSSSYSIQCLLVYDAEKNTCSAPAEPPAELKIQLTDAAEKSLAGGGFEIREDVDADGVLGLADKLVPDGACVTTDDGMGTCSFSALKPGTYLVSQVVAPPGYAPTKEPFPVELVSGESRTVVFTNTSSLSAVNITLEGEDGQPLSGGSFAIYPDPDADGKVAPDAQPSAKCDTAADGTCSMTVPAGSYVLVQTAAPDGLEPIEPVPFVISSGGQVAAVEAVNYPFGTPPEAAPAASPTFTYQPPPADLPPELHTVPLPIMGIPQDQPEVAPHEGTGAVIGNTVERIVRAPGDALRLLARSPAEAIAFAAAVLLFALACAAIDRRRKLLALTAAG